MEFNIRKYAKAGARIDQEAMDKAVDEDIRLQCGEDPSINDDFMKTTDAKKWAQAYAVRFGGQEDILLAWFANAIEKGRLEGNKTINEKLQVIINNLMLALKRIDVEECRRLAMSCDCSADEFINGYAGENTISGIARAALDSVTSLDLKISISINMLDEILDKAWECFTDSPKSKIIKDICSKYGFEIKG